MEKIKKLIKKIKNIRIKKVHLDYIAGLLSIPVLITAVVINYTNLNSRNNKTATAPAPTSSPSASKVIVVTQRVAPTSALSCAKSIGPIDISYPTEGQEVSDNPLCITIDYPNNNYCPVIWSYRINNGSWSDFGNSAPCLYNLPSGSVRFSLRVNSAVSSDNTTLVRNFVYSGSNNISTPTPTLSLTPTLTLTPTPTQSVSTSSAK